MTEAFFGGDRLRRIVIARRLFQPTKQS